MANDSLPDLLNRLHTALDERRVLTTEDRALLDQLSADIQALLARSGAPTGDVHAGFASRLGGAITRFEVSHPDLTTLMAQVSKKLADMGI
jgi:hypothetical protein